MSPLRTPIAALALALGLTIAAGPALAVPAGAPATAPATAPAASTATTPATVRVTNPATPGDFTGYGFDQCLAPTQKSMNRWLRSSPFLAAGIYISGKSRACREQPNLTPEWIATQLGKGWRLLPITLGPQASCQPRFPRYDDDVRIDPTPGADKTYAAAYAQGLAEASTTVTDAQALGIVAGSTLWYDLEGFDHGDTHCRESALRFLGGWTVRLHELGYVSGVYSSVGSGIKALDDARVQRPGLIVLPDRIWLARWDGVANTSSSYIREDGWRPGGRVKQYQGGHNETWGGVTINIDRNFLELGQGSVAAPETHCGGTRVDFKKYPRLSGASQGRRMDALRCLLKEQGYPVGRPRSVKRNSLPPAMGSWLQAHGFGVTATWQRKHWTALLAQGARPVLKTGSAGEGVYRLQRALNAAGTPRLAVTGVFDAATDAAVRTWQQQAGLPVTGVIAPRSWKRLQAGGR